MGLFACPGVLEGALGGGTGAAGGGVDGGGGRWGSGRWWRGWSESMGGDEQQAAAMPHDLLACVVSFLMPKWWYRKEAKQQPK